MGRAASKPKLTVINGSSAEQSETAMREYWDGVHKEGLQDLSALCEQHIDIFWEIYHCMNKIICGARNKRSKNGGHP